MHLHEKKIWTSIHRAKFLFTLTGQSMLRTTNRRITSGNKNVFLSCYSSLMSLITTIRIIILLLLIFWPFLPQLQAGLCWRKVREVAIGRNVPGQKFVIVLGRSNQSIAVDALQRGETMYGIKSSFRTYIICKRQSNQTIITIIFCDIPVFNSLRVIKLLRWFFFKCLKLHKNIFFYTKDKVAIPQRSTSRTASVLISVHAQSLGVNRNQNGNENVFIFLR